MTSTIGNKIVKCVLASVNVYVHYVCALNLAVDKKFIVFLPCFDMLLQVQQIVLFDEQRFEDVNVVG